ncbi:MAG: hypothetical protein II781_02000 [Clostridia bacterium]|nr:hypothetical protein [Clostridia bacterium]
MILNLLAYGFILIPILVIVIYNCLNHNYARRHFVWFAGFGTLWQIVSAGLCIVLFTIKGISSYDFSIFWDFSDPGAAYFSLDYRRLFFLLIIGLVAFISVLIARHTIDTNRSSYCNLLLILLLGMNGMILVTDLFSIYVFMEVIGICCFVMIAMFRSREDLEGSFKYLVMSELASIMILTGLAFLFMKTGSLRFQDLRIPQTGLDYHKLPDFLMPVSVALLLSGFALKAGVVPFHSWLPDAHQSADTSVSVLLSGIVIKIAGIYGLMVISSMFGNVAAISKTFAALGLLSILVGALLATQQGHFKRIIAYSSVSQMGYILLGLSTQSVLGLVGALGHILSHALFKSTLFANAAAVHEKTGSLELKDMGGLENQMPKTAFSSLIAFLSTAGIPPMAGFWSKLLILLALWTNQNRIAAAIALFASILTAVYLLRIQSKVFFGQTREEYKDLEDVKGSILFAEILLTVLTIAIGLIWPLVLRFMSLQGLF